MELKKKSKISLLSILIVVTLFSTSGVLAVILDDTVFIPTEVTGYNFSIVQNSTIGYLNVTDNGSIIFSNVTYLKIKNVDSQTGYLNFTDINSNKILRNVLTSSTIYDFSSGSSYDLVATPSLEVELLNNPSSGSSLPGGGGTPPQKDDDDEEFGDLYRLRVELPNNVDLTRKNSVYVYLEDIDGNYLNGVLSATIQGGVGDLDITKKESGVFLLSVGSSEEDELKIDIEGFYEGKTIKETITLTENDAINELENEDLIAQIGSGGGSALKKISDTISDFLKEKGNLIIWIIVFLLLILIFFITRKIIKEGKK